MCAVAQPAQSPYEVDLLHPLPSVEAQRHKLKRLVQTPNSFFMDVKCPGCFNMCVSLRPSTRACVSFVCSAVALCVANVLSLACSQQHHCLQPRTDRGPVRLLQYGAVPADGWQGQAHRGLLIPTEG